MGKEFSVDLGVALPCSRPMAANEVENSNDPQEASQLKRASRKFSDDLGVALPCSRPMAASEVENSNDPQEVCQLWKNFTICLFLHGWMGPASKEDFDFILMPLEVVLTVKHINYELQETTYLSLYPTLGNYPFIYKINVCISFSKFIFKKEKLFSFLSKYNKNLLTLYHMFEQCKLLYKCWCLNYFFWFFTHL